MKRRKLQCSKMRRRKRMRMRRRMGMRIMAKNLE
jgi:hypothetical protein